MAERLRLSVLRGPRAGEVFLVGAGQRLVVGRTPEAGIFVSDPQISRRHFELYWDGERCTVSDLGSTNGTLLNGQRVRSATLRDGDRIEAGDTTFGIEIRDEPLIAPAPRAIEPPAPSLPEPPRPVPPPVLVGPPRPPPPPTAEGAPPEPPPLRVAEDRAEPEPPTSDPVPLATPRDDSATAVVPVAIFESVERASISAAAARPPEGTLLKKLVDFLETQASGSLYALIDGARSAEPAFWARRMGSDLYTLFSGSMAVEVAHAGPCLAPLPSPLPFLEKWVEELGDNAGILLESGADLEALYRHLRGIFVVTDEEDQEFFFRYYDPRVLRTYLPTCTPDELAEFFGPVTRWIAEDEKGESLRSYELRAGSVFETALTS